MWKNDFLSAIIATDLCNPVRCNMKRVLSLLLAILTLNLYGCGKKNAVVPEEKKSGQGSAVMENLKESSAPLSFFRDIQQLELRLEEKLICSVEYPMLKLSAADAQKYPVLKRSLDSVNTSFIKNAQSLFDNLSSLAEDAYFSDAEAFTPFRRDIFVALPRADSKAVSILCSSSVFSVGEHEEIAYSCLNLDTLSGREIDIRSLVSDMKTFRSVLETSLSMNYPDVSFDDLMRKLNRYMESPTDFVWTVDYQGITVYFSPGELAGFDAGLISVSLRFDSYPELLNQSFAEVPAAYVSPLINGKCFNFDLDLSGNSDSIQVSDRYDDKLGYSDMLTININGNITTTKTGLKAYDCYVIHAGLNRNYLFINGENLSEYGYINVYRIDRTGATFVGGMYDTSLHAAGFSGYCEGRTVLTNPESFVMGTLCKLLCPQAGIKTYSIGVDGMPISLDSCYLLSSSEILTSKNELATVSVDPVTGNGSQSAVKIPGKTQFYFWRTDGSSFIDMKTGIGTCCRLFITTKNKTQYVNGIHAEELFDGIA